MNAYNCERFDAYVESGEDEREFGAFPQALHAGERAPDGELTALGGERVRLSELWRWRLAQSTGLGGFGGTGLVAGVRLVGARQGRREPQYSTYWGD